MVCLGLLAVVPLLLIVGFPEGQGASVGALGREEEEGLFGQLDTVFTDDWYSEQELAARVIIHLHS